LKYGPITASFSIAWPTTVCRFAQSGSGALSGCDSLALRHKATLATQFHAFVSAAVPWALLEGLEGPTSPEGPAPARGVGDLAWLPSLLTAVDPDLNAPPQGSHSFALGGCLFELVASSDATKSKAVGRAIQALQLLRQ
jgi:hypothetical protein